MFIFTGEQGLEPRYSGPKPDVLPLDDPPNYRTPLKITGYRPVIKGLLLLCLEHQEQRKFFARPVFRIPTRALLAHAMRYPFFEACEDEAVLGEFFHVELQRPVV